MFDTDVYLNFVDKARSIRWRVMGGKRFIA